MLKKILVALDPDADTPVAIRHATSIARWHEASLTGLAVIDTGHIDTESHSDALGGVYHTSAMQEGLTSEAQRQAEQLTEEFKELAAPSGIAFETRIRQGMPFRRITEEMKYHDLLVVGETPHFFYSQPKQRTKTLARVVRDTLAPTLIVREDREPPVERVLIAYDGGDAAARTLHAFAHLRPFGSDVTVRLLHVHDNLPDTSQRLLERARDYLRAHDFEAKVESVEGGTPKELIVAHTQETEADVVVAGTHPVSKLRKLTFGSITASLIEDCPASMFVHH